MTDHMTDDNDGDPQAEPSERSENADLKKSLINRVAIAGVLIIALLGGLAVLDQLNAPQATRQPAVTAPIAITEPAPPAPSTVEEKPAEPAVPEEVAKTEEPAVEPETSAPPTASTKPLRAEHPERPLTKPAEPRQAMLKPSEPLLPAKRPEPVAELAKIPHAPHAPHTVAPASRPLIRSMAQSRVFLLQLGVFSNMANAEELRAKLELNGIPTQIETRVHVGPFNSQLEVEQVREQLKKLGLQDGVLVTAKK